MAKKLVKYSFGNSASYAALAKKDQYTIYFVYDTVKDANGKDVPSEYGTLYKGTTRIGSAKASDIVFDTKLDITVLQGATPEESLVYTIDKGTSLTDFVNGLLKQIGTWDQSLYSQFVGDGTPENPGIILSTIQQESSFDAKGNGLGTVSNAINDAINRSITPKSEGGTEVISSWVNNNFVSNDKLGKIQELAGILDDETIEILINAATNIQNVLKDYYTKDEADAKLKDVLFFTSWDDFPAAGDASILYVDCDENILYRWGEDEGVEDYIPVGGSGAGTGDVKTETKIFVKGGRTTLSVAKGTPLTIEFVFSSAYTQMKYDKKTGTFQKIMQETGTTGSARYYLDGVQFDSGSVRQSSYDEEGGTGAHVNIYNKLVVPASRLTSTTHEVKITCVDGEGNSVTEQIFINVISATITSSYVATPTNLTTNIRIPVSVTSTTAAELFYTIDNEDVVKVQDVPVGSPVITISIPPTDKSGATRTHGYHTIKIWATTYIEESDTTISTSILRYDVIWYEEGNTLPIVTTSYNRDANDDGAYDIVQYEYGTLKYQVYSYGQATTVVDLIVKNLSTSTERIVNTLEVDTVTKSWTYTFDDTGEYEIYVAAHYGNDQVLESTKYHINVAKSSITMDATPGSVLYFTAKNRSNNETNKARWTDEIGGVEAVLENFLWNNNSGWYTDNATATTSLKVSGGARCTIPYSPFAYDKRETGQVIEIDFSTSNLSDATAEVISCYSASDKSGIQITATGAYFSSNEFGQTTDGDARIHVPFKENERVRISFVITPWLADEEGHGPDDPGSKVSLWNGSGYEEQNSVSLGWWRFVKVYINGICVSINNYSSEFTQSNPANIVIGSDKATVDVYSIRVYDTVLYDRSIVNNFIADTQDPNEKLRLFKRNNILNELGTDVEPTAIRRLMPCLFVTCQTDATVSGITNNEHILPTNKNDKRGVSMFFDCDGLDDDAREYYNFCHTFVAFNVQFAVQGTSSQYYPRRNWKATFKPEKSFKSDYVATATGSKPTYIFNDVPWEDEIKNGRDARATYVNKYQEKYSNKYVLKDFSEEFSKISDEKRTVNEISTIPAKKFCLKADFAESSGTHNTGFAKYVDFIFKSMGYDYLTPPQKAQYNKTKKMTDVTFRTSVDGYPIAMFWRPTFDDPWQFYGKFNFNLDKGAESAFGFIDLSDGNLGAADVNPMTGQPFVEFNEAYYDAASQEDRIAYEVPIECWEFTNNSTDLCKFRNITPTSFTETSKDADGVTELPAWLGSFEVRHPDNDNIINIDYGTGLKKPTHWAKFSEWVCSTDRQGVHNYDKNLPVPTTWTGTFDELNAGASDKEIFAVYEGKLSELIEQTKRELQEIQDWESSGPHTEDEVAPVMTIDINRRYILQPTVADEGDGTISPDMSYDLYGHVVHYNIAENDKWYDASLEKNTWVDDGEYVEEESEVDYNKAYYIPDTGRVYTYDTKALTWKNIASIEQYKLEKEVVYSMTTYKYDTAEYRLAKFKNELSKHMNIPVTTAYYVLTEFFGCADQRAKNMMFVSWGYEPGASSVKPASAYSSEEAANKAGYKGVYSYEIGTIASAPTPAKYFNDDALVLGAAPTGLCINEICPASKQMEFYNAGSSTLDISGYKLLGVDDEGASRAEWTFPAGTSVASHGRKVITFKSSDVNNGPTYGLSGKKAWSFTLQNKTGETIDTITNYTPGVIGGELVTQPDATAGTGLSTVCYDLSSGSLARSSDGAETWQIFAVPTIGEANSAQDAPEPELPATQLASYLEYETNITELSGLCFNEDKTGLYGVSDRGKVYKIGFDGKSDEIKLSGDVNNTDFEGITIYDGHVYILSESDTDKYGEIYELNTSNGNITKIVSDLPKAQTGGQGYEGIAAFGVNKFYVGNQSNPVAIYKHDGTLTTVTEELKGVSEIADLSFDSENIWVIDSKDFTICKYTIEGELLERYVLNFLSKGANPESLCIDKENNIAWVACDTADGGPLYKVSLSNDPFDTTIVINEVDPENKRWELYNTTNKEIDMTGYGMTKTDETGEDTTRRFVFGQVPATAKIAAHGFMVLEQSDGVTGPSFGLSGSKGFNYKIYNTEGTLIEHLDNLTTIVKINDGETYGRSVDGGDKFVIFKNHGSIGSTNANGILKSSELYINEIDSKNKKFELYNAGASPINLEGYTFWKDNKSSWTLTAERLTTAVGEGLGVSASVIAPEQRVVVTCNNKTPDETKYPDFGISGTKGFVLAVRDKNGNLLDEVSYLAENPAFLEIVDGTTIGRYPDGGSEFHLFNTPTIGVANNAGTPLKSLVAAKSIAEGRKVVINEICPSTDTIELYNTSSEVVSLSGFGLIKNNDFGSVWSFPTTASIQPKGFYVINLKQWNTAVGPTFGISATDGFVLTLTNGTNVEDTVDNLATSDKFISLMSGYTMGRTPDGADDWQVYEVGSIGETNANGTIYEPEVIDPGASITNHIVINEINGTSKMIELYNPTSQAVSLRNFGLLKVDTDAYSETDWYTFPEDATIPAKGYFTVCADKSQSGEDGKLHTLFGISLNPGKSFHLYLVSYTGSLDTTSKESIISTGTVVDDIDNLTDPITSDVKDDNSTYGRVNDGSENWAMFAVGTTASVTGPSTDSKLSNANGQLKPQGGTGGGAVTGTIKKVLYWVPIDSEYVYYPIFYDNDTILSLDNTGHIKFNPNVESTDRVGTGYAYNGTESVLWINFKDAYDAEIRTTYVNMRSKGGLTYANCMKYFNDSQSAQWPENVYNIDGKFKYVIPATKGYVDYSTQDNTGKYGVTIRNSTYLYECQGSREEHRKWWLNNRFTYMDSRYFAVSYAEDYATIRLYTPSLYAGVTPSSTFKLTPYADMYLRVMFGQIVSTLRAEKNKTYDIIPSDPNLRFNDTETIIYGASNILSFGDMTNKYAGSVAIDKASKITDIVLGANEPYYNENITGAGLTIGAGNTTLKNIDVRGCTKLTSIVGLNQVTSIETVDARRTGITAFDFSTEGANLKEVYYANTVTDVKLVNMNNITYDNIHIPTYENLKSLWIENCPQMKSSSWNMVQNILSTANNKLATVRITGLEWSINTTAAYEAWKKLLKLRGYTSSGLQQSAQIPHLSGTVSFGSAVKVSTGFKDGIEKMFNNVNDMGQLKVTVVNTAGLDSIKIVPEKDILDHDGVAQMAPDVEYKFNISYGPDDYVLASEKGVTWDIPQMVDGKGLQIVEQTQEYVVLKYIGSSGGNVTYQISAKSIKDTSLVHRMSIRPGATLSAIRVTNTLQQQVNGQTIDINEGETMIFNVSFVPEGTTDTDVKISITAGKEYLELVNGDPQNMYDPVSKTLTIKGANVDRTRQVSVVITSTSVPSVFANLTFNVKNVVSRIFHLKDAATAENIPGYIVVKYTDRFTGKETESTFYTETGTVTLRTDSSVGFSKLEVTAEANAAVAIPIQKAYNKPATITVAELATTASTDVERTFDFYEPITAKITINNAGAPVKDRNLLIESFENASIRQLDGSQRGFEKFNKITGGMKLAGEPAEIMLLANTTHTITITELDDRGEKVVSGGRYSQYTGTITTTTSNAEYTITISRDYLGNIDSNELHMTVITPPKGGNYETKTVVRLYVQTKGTITINWGDKEDYSGSSDSTRWTTTVNNTNGQVISVRHKYNVNAKEYDICVEKDTGWIQWMHVIKPDAQAMLPCFGGSDSDDTFDAAFPARYENVGGLVAYQSVGKAEFVHRIPTFRFENKNNSNLLCIGDIFVNCTDPAVHTTAANIFENTTIEQISDKPLFEQCEYIKSFNSTFKNSNVTSLPPNFFMTNTRATDFRETFSGCTQLSSINSAENIAFINPSEDTEITSLYHMFYNCTNLSSQVPALWKTFYGCSFASITEQQTFRGCTKVSNYINIPYSWGGNTITTYEETAFKHLKYLDLRDTKDSSNTRAGAEFILSGIYPEGDWRYQYEVEYLSNFYEMQALFGCASTDDPEKFEEKDAKRVLDFWRGGYHDGSNPNIYTGAFLYRPGTSHTADWNYAPDAVNTNLQAAVFAPPRDMGNRIVIDIMHSANNKVTVWKVGNEANKMEYFINSMADAKEFKANLPLKLMGVYPNNQIKTVYDNGIATRGCEVIIYSLKIYNGNNELIHNLYPVYGKDPDSAQYIPMLYDETMDKTYRVSGADISKLKYYAKITQE